MTIYYAYKLLNNLVKCFSKNISACLVTNSDLTTGYIILTVVGDMNCCKLYFWQW